MRFDWKPESKERHFRKAEAAVEEIYTGGLAKVTLNLRGGQSINFTECKG